VGFKGGWNKKGKTRKIGVVSIALTPDLRCVSLLPENKLLRDNGDSEHSRKGV
jgi:hypothetical protein